MGFYYNDAPPPARRAPGGRNAVVPIASLNRMGCAVCPRDKDATLRMPKCAPAGDDQPLVYFLGMRPTRGEDTRGEMWTGIAAHAVESKFSGDLLDRAKFGYILQCAPDANDDDLKHPSEHELECCRGRVAQDIAASQPLVVVGYGDEPMHWATGIKGSCVPFRGTPIAARIGGRAVWYYPLTYPNWTTNDRRSKSEYEWAMEYDARTLEDMLEAGAFDNPPPAEQGPYDGGIERITGNDPGDMQRLEEALHWLVSTQIPHGLDIETTGLKPTMLRNPLILTAAVGTFERTVAFSVSHPDGWGTETRMRNVMGMLGDYVAQSGRKRCHHAGFEQEWLGHLLGERVLRRTEWEDTMAMAWSVDERPGTKSLDVQTQIHYGFSLKKQSLVDVAQNNWWILFPLRDVLRYNGLDTKWTDRLATDRLPVVKSDPRTAELYENKMTQVPTLVMTTARGLPIDFAYARELSDSIKDRVDAIEAQVRRLPEVRQYTQRHGTFSITNNDHVLKLYRDVMQRPEVEIEDWDGNVSYSVKEDVLALMPATEVPSAKLILEHRGLNRNETTYLGPLLAGELTGPDGMIHAEYSSMHTVTSRLSSPMHNWPKHKHKEVRGVVAPDEDQWFVAADQGQIEFRVAGMLSGDDKIIEYSWTKYDVHKYWAQRMIDEYPRVKDWVIEEFELRDWEEKGLGLKNLRQVAKNNWVFPQLFGAKFDSCARNCHIPLPIAEGLAGEFWDEFRGAKRWQEDLIRSYQKHLYVETMGGFRRHGPMTVNELINAPIQGTACEIVLAGQVALSELADANEEPELHPAFNGHDDLSFIIGDADLERHIHTIAFEMCKPRFDYVCVPLVVEVSVGPRWHQLEEIGKYSSEDMHGQRNPYA